MAETSNQGGFCKLVCWLVGIGAGGYLGFELVTTYGQDQAQSGVIGLVAMLLVSLLLRRMVCRGDKNRVRERVAEAERRRREVVADDVDSPAAAKPAKAAVEMLSDGPVPVDEVDSKLAAQILAAASEAVSAAPVDTAQDVEKPVKNAPADMDGVWKSLTEAAADAPDDDDDGYDDYEAADVSEDETEDDVALAPVPLIEAVKKAAEKEQAKVEKDQPNLDAIAAKTEAPAAKADKPAPAMVATPKDPSDAIQAMAKTAAPASKVAEPTGKSAASASKPGDAAAKPAEAAGKSIKSAKPSSSGKAAAIPAAPSTPLKPVPVATSVKPAASASAEVTAEKPAKPAAIAADNPAPASEVAMTAPKGLDAPENGKADDLKQIDGIGAAQESALNAAGIYYYQQIVGMNRRELAWIDQNIKSDSKDASAESWRKQAIAISRQAG